jgi:hypothetical protein
MKHWRSIVLALALTGCAHIPMTDPTGPPVSGIILTPTGQLWPQRLHDTWVREGVPASYFTREPRDMWYINDIDYHAGNAVRDRAANPVKW